MRANVCNDDLQTEKRRQRLRRLACVERWQRCRSISFGRELCQPFSRRDKVRSPLVIGTIFPQITAHKFAPKRRSAGLERPRFTVYGVAFPQKPTRLAVGLGLGNALRGEFRDSPRVPQNQIAELMVPPRRPSRVQEERRERLRQTIFQQQRCYARPASYVKKKLTLTKGRGGVANVERFS